MDRIPVRTPQEILERLRGAACEHHRSYLAMYSTWYGGIVTDPALMLVPIDDHMVHRGDGVFEAFKCVQGKVYLLGQHLDRLERSASMIGIALPFCRSELEAVILETVRAAGRQDCLVRLYISRGPGDFSPVPSACLGSQLYIVVTETSRTDPRKEEAGCSLMTSSIPTKPGVFATVKSCNYLPNVLMEKEAEEHGVDFVVALDESGRLAEGPTENIGLVSKDGTFLVPPFDRTLRGTTVQRMMELASSLVERGDLRAVHQAPVSVEDLHRAREVMLFGTTFDILPVVRFEERPIGEGEPGPLFRTFLDLMRMDQLEGAKVLTPIARQG